MFRQPQHDKLLVIVGPTASGKSALGLKLAQKFNGEIICADSKTVYRYMDIGTAKPSNEEMLLIQHHLVNIKNPNVGFSAGQFKRLASAAIEDVSQKGHLAIMVGGTGLYVDSVLFDYRFPKAENKELRIKNRGLSLEQLAQQLKQLDPDIYATIDLKNPRRVMRAIELAGQPRSKSVSMRPNTLVLGLSLSKESIHNRINQRIEKMLTEGLIDEVRQVSEQFGWDSEAMAAPAYKAFKEVVLGRETLGNAQAMDIKLELSLAKRQMTWFKRNQDIRWLDAEDPAVLYAEAERQVRMFVGAGFDV